jgi:hypothetical protein
MCNHRIVTVPLRFLNVPPKTLQQPCDSIRSHHPQHEKTMHVHVPLFSNIIITCI